MERETQPLSLPHRDKMETRYRSFITHPPLRISFRLDCMLIAVGNKTQ